MSPSRTSVSIICVFNRPSVREQCLDRSIRALADQFSDVEYLPIDNIDGLYPSAGAALNHGVSLARNDVAVFVHQDVYLHSLTALKDAAGHIRNGAFGVLGAVGVRADGLLLGRIRDRIILAGVPVEHPAEVDSLDEVLFMASRPRLMAEPLSESPQLGWHGYAVEYGLRMRRQGLRTGVANLPITHNSLSVNLDGLGGAHRALADWYPDLLPVATTCGAIRGRKGGPDRRKALARYRWRYQWVRDSVALQRARRSSGRSGAVLADLRYDIDALVQRAPGRTLTIVNSNHGRSFDTGGDDLLTLARTGGEVSFADCAAIEIPRILARLPPGSWALVTNLTDGDVRELESWLPAMPSTLGYHRGTNLWLLLGPAPTELPEGWRSRRASPLRVGFLAGAALRLGKCDRAASAARRHC